MFNLTDPSKNSYYLLILGVLIIISLIIQLLISIIKNLKKEPEIINDSMDNELSGNFGEISHSNNLKKRYLIAYALFRSALYSKVPYLYALFMTVHKFSMVEIGILYFLARLLSLIFSSFIYEIVCKYLRKKFCIFYNISRIIYLLLIMQGSRVTAYLGQIVAGLGSRPINSIFEGWVDCESKRLFRSERKAEIFTKKLLKISNSLDVVVSFLTLIICAIVYSFMGIYAPFWISIGLFLLDSIVIYIYWDENRPSAEENENTFQRIIEALYELKKVNVLCIGLIEGIIMTALYIILFSWTPILKQSTPGEMNFGFAYTCMVFSMFLGTKLYELFIVYLNIDYYILLTICFFIQGFLLFISYFQTSFLARLICLSLFACFIGVYNPLNKIIESKIICKEHRDKLVFLFRIPIYIYLFIILLLLRFMNPFTLALISGSLAFIACIIGTFLYIYSIYHPQTINNNNIQIEFDNHEENEILLNNINDNEEAEEEKKNSFSDLKI